MKYGKMHGRKRPPRRELSASDQINDDKDYLKNRMKTVPSSSSPSAFSNVIRRGMKFVYEKLKDKAKSD